MRLTFNFFHFTAVDGQDPVAQEAGDAFTDRHKSAWAGVFSSTWRLQVRRASCRGCGAVFGGSRSLEKRSAKMLAAPGQHLQSSGRRKSSFRKALAASSVPSFGILFGKSRAKVQGRRHRPWRPWCASSVYRKIDVFDFLELTGFVEASSSSAFNLVFDRLAYNFFAAGGLL